jgi:hypothetical protein
MKKPSPNQESLEQMLRVGRLDPNWVGQASGQERRGSGVHHDPSSWVADIACGVLV